jgi:hypothetical protein
VGGKVLVDQIPAPLVGLDGAAVEINGDQVNIAGGAMGDGVSQIGPAADDAVEGPVADWSADPGPGQVVTDRPHDEVPLPGVGVAGIDVGAWREGVERLVELELEAAMR